jgi:hypothetical protein
MDVNVADILRQSGWWAATMTMAANASLIRHATPMSQPECCDACLPAGWVRARKNVRNYGAPAGIKEKPLRSSI